MNIYVGNLSNETTEDEIRTEFESFGKVAKVKVIKDKTTGKSRGFGFVTMPNVSEAITAINRLDGYKIGDRALKVNKARPRRNEGRKTGSKWRNYRSYRDRQRRGSEGMPSENPQ